MDDHLRAVAKGQKGLLLLAELSQHAAIVGGTGNSYAEKYLQKGAYRETPETGIQWVMRCMSTPRYFYKMFRMSLEVFNELHDLLVSNYGLTSNKNVSSIESLAMFYGSLEDRNYFRKLKIDSHGHFGRFTPSFMKY